MRQHSGDNRVVSIEEPWSNPVPRHPEDNGKVSGQGPWQDKFLAKINWRDVFSKP